MERTIKMTNLVQDEAVQRELTQTGRIGGSTVYTNDPSLHRQLEDQAIIAEPVYPEYTVLEKHKIRVRTRAIDLMKLKLVRNKFKLPDLPTYTAKLPSGKTEEIQMDEVAAQDNSLDSARWNTYITRKKEAEENQNDKIVITIFFLGTEILDPLPDGWDVEQELLGIDIPTHPEMRKAHFLMTETTQGDIKELMRCIMGKSGVTEKDVAVAEEAFRG